ncbi:MAG TPA: M1 family metallopeptidase [Gemmatimonadales bacterium]|nr:M1 family metallopeptidase [Gemmatimonadales bacterium]
MQHYRFDLAFSDADDTLRASATVSARYITGGDSTLRLDLVQPTLARQGRGMTVESVHSGDRLLAYRHTGDVLLIYLGRHAVPGELVTVRIAYHGNPADALRFGPNKHGDRTIFSDNWPDKARNWLPTVDHPYDKATSEMVVTAPSHYQVVSNGLQVEETDLGHGMRLTHWKQSVPIATWLYTLGVAEFAVQRVGTCEGVPVETWVYRQDRDAGFHDFQEPTCDVLHFFSERIGPFAYEKLANVVSAAVNGGMEAASAIMYGEPSVTGTRATNWQNVIAHEIAHQWFGNAVTEGDWDDVWLSEGFATYFTLLYREHARGRDDFVSGLAQSRETIRKFYAETPDYRVVHDGLRDMSQVTNGMTYQKGAWTLHMLRNLIGDEAYWRGIQAYYREHFNGNASTADFQRAMEEASGQSLDAFFDQWLRQGGIPVFRAVLGRDDVNGLAVVTLIPEASAHRFTVPVEFGIDLADGSRVTGHATITSGQPVTIPIKVASPPRTLTIDPETKLLAEWVMGTGP